MCAGLDLAWAVHEIGHGQAGMSQEILGRSHPQAACATSGVSCSGTVLNHSLIVVCRDPALPLEMSFGALNDSKHFTDCVCSSAELILSQKLHRKEPVLVLAHFF